MRFKRRPPKGGADPAGINDCKPDADLEKYGDAFRFQLVAAQHLERWARRLPDSPAADQLDSLEVRGWVDALQTVSTYLRQGYYLPGGEMYPADERQALNTNSPI